MNKEAILNRKEHYLEKSKCFCIFPWLGYRNLHGYYSPCPCMWRKNATFTDKNNLRKRDYTEMANDDDFKQLRKAMIEEDTKNEIFSYCEMCKLYNVDSNINAAREWGNFYFGEFFEDAIENTNDDFSLKNTSYLKYMYISLNNVCNFKCRFCEPERSSAWKNDWEQLYGEKIDINFYNPSSDEKHKLLKDIETEAEKCKLIHFSHSGEPFSTYDHIQILNHLIETGKTNVHLLYNSNMSLRYYKAYDIYKLLSKFDKVIILMSIDGLYDYNKILRGYDNKTNWDLIEKNIEDLIKEVPGLELHLHSVVGALNVMHLPKLHKEFYNRGYIKANRVRLNPIFKDVYTAQIFPQELKLKTKEILEEHIEWLKTINNEDNIYNFYHGKVIDEYRSFINYMFKEDKSNQIEKFIWENKKLDEIRGVDTENTIIELKPIFNLLNK